MALNYWKRSKVLLFVAVCLFVNLQWLKRCIIDNGNFHENKKSAALLIDSCYAIKCVTVLVFLGPRNTNRVSQSHRRQTVFCWQAQRDWREDCAKCCCGNSKLDGISWNWRLNFLNLLHRNPCQSFPILSHPCLFFLEWIQKQWASIAVDRISLSWLHCIKLQLHY